MSQEAQQPEPPSNHGRELAAQTPEQALDAASMAVDYRGDVRLETHDGDVVEGYVFDIARKGPEPVVRLMPKDGSPRMSLPVSQISRLVFSGRDAAAGKSWETWVKKYQERRAKGLDTNLYPDALDE